MAVTLLHLASKCFFQHTNTFIQLSHLSPKFSAVVLPLAIRSKDAAKIMWGTTFAGCSLAPPLFSLKSVATGKCTPFRHGVKSLLNFVDVIEYWWLACNIHSSVWTEHPCGISTMRTDECNEAELFLFDYWPLLSTIFPSRGRLLATNRPLSSLFLILRIYSLLPKIPAVAGWPLPAHCSPDHFLYHRLQRDPTRLDTF